MYKLFAYVALGLASFALVAQGAVEHRVKRGETLAEIAQAYKVGVKEIQQANNISNENRISIGQVLQIPGVSVATGAKHIVSRGETLAEIANDYGISVRSLKDANHLTDANHLSIGQSIIIPGLPESKAPASPQSGAEHRVRPSETLTEIADDYDVSVEAIKGANGLTNANMISVGQVLEIPSTEPKIVEYTIRRGDSLSDIASSYGISVKDLTRLNGIQNAGKIRVGQKIKIPVSASKYRSMTSAPQLASSNLSDLKRIRPKNNWRHIVIHHSGSRAGSAKSFDRFHREERNMENGLAYHFVIGNGNGMGDGELAIGDRWKRQIHGGHVSSYTLNQISIGICLVGDFSKNKPTTRQMATLEALVRYLMDETHVPVARVTTHTLIHPKHTLCPGKYFPTNDFKAKLAR